MAISSEEVNFLVYRYLQESGFTHAAFTFGYEAFVHKSGISGADVPAGALVSFLQKGIQYIELEANLNEDGSRVDGSFLGLTSHDLLTKDVSELRRILDEKRIEQMEVDREREERQARSLANAAGPTSISDSQVRTLNGHTSEVFICSWSPTSLQLASGAGDSTARIWDLSGRGAEPIVLEHRTNEKGKDVTTLDWSGDGEVLATGSYDGLARVWSRGGALQQVLSGHEGPIFALKWNRRSDLLLSGSVDRTSIIWDVKTGQVKQQFRFHTAPTLDVDWKDGTSFASCSTDKMIHVCCLGQDTPVKSFRGHQDEVNTIKWDPQGRLLASCSDDHTAKLWSTSQEECLHDLTLHTKEIYTIKWSPSGPGTANPNQELLLVSASFDASIRLWNVERGECVSHLTKHTQPVYSVAFSPNGEFLASGSFDKNLHIWSVKDSSLVRTYKGAGGIFEVCWNADGDHVAASFATGSVAVLDLRM